MPGKVNHRVALAFSVMLKRILSIPASAKRVMVYTFDIFAALVSVWFAILLSAEFKHGLTGSQWYLYLIAPGLMLPIFFSAGIYQAVYRYSGFNVFLAVVRAVCLYGIVFLFMILILKIPDVPRSVGVMQPIMFLLMIGGSRAMVRFWFSSPRLARSGNQPNCLLIYGAGKAGTEIVRALQQSGRFNIAGYLDDDRALQGRRINGLPVFDPQQVPALIVELKVNTLLVAMPSASRLRRMEIVRSFQSCPVNIKTLPGIDEIADGKVTISDIKEVQIEELLGRDVVPVDRSLVERSVSGNVIMVTGAGGSIGSEICRQLLSADPKKLLLLDNCEYNLYNIHTELENLKSTIGCDSQIVPLLCDVSKKNRIEEISRVFSPSVIYHAAAYKHVPMVEYNLAEGVRNNVFGTLNVIRVAMEYGVSKVMLVSTDKAVRPTSVMGASKRLCEMILQAYAAQGGHSTCFAMVRFGNVLGSSGSVVPLFRRQIRDGGPITVTHEEITRYFMTITEAAQLVIQAGAMAVGGDVYLLDMGSPVKIIDLARRMVFLSGLSVRDSDNPEGDIEISVTGLRPGEKLYEELLIGDNSVPTVNPRIFKAIEECISLAELHAGLDLLFAAVKKNDVITIRQLLKILVQEYQPEESSMDILFMEQTEALQMTLDTIDLRSVCA